MQAVALHALQAYKTTSYIKYLHSTAAAAAAVTSVTTT